MKNLLKKTIKDTKKEPATTRGIIVGENLMNKKSFVNFKDKGKLLAENAKLTEDAQTQFLKTNSNDDKKTRDETRKVFYENYAEVITELNLFIKDDLSLALETGAELSQSGTNSRKGGKSVGQAVILECYNTKIKGQLYIKIGKIENAIRHVFRFVPDNFERLDPLQKDSIVARLYTTLSDLPINTPGKIYVCGIDGTGISGAWSNPFLITVV